MTSTCSRSRPRRAKSRPRLASSCSGVTTGIPSSRSKRRCSYQAPLPGPSERIAARRLVPAGGGGGEDRAPQQLAVAGDSPRAEGGLDLRPHRFAHAERVGGAGGHPQVVLQDPQLAALVADQVEPGDGGGRHLGVDQPPHRRLVALRGLEQVAGDDAGFEDPLRPVGVDQECVQRPRPLQQPRLQRAPTPPPRSAAAPGRRRSPVLARTQAPPRRPWTGRARAALPGPAARAPRSAPRRDGAEPRSGRRPRRSSPLRAGNRRHRERIGPVSRSSPWKHGRYAVPAIPWPGVEKAALPTSQPSKRSRPPPVPPAFPAFRSAAVSTSGWR